MKHETSENEQMKTGKRSGKPLIITDQPAEAHGRGKGALHRRESRDKAALNLGQFDDLQLHAMLFGLLLRYAIGVALVHQGDARPPGRSPLARLEHGPAHWPASPAE
jgi:hypothetical protein